VVPRQEPHEQIHLAGALIDPAVAADRSIHGRGGPSAKMRPRPTDRSQPRSGTGPCWVRTALGATGSGWTRAVTTGRYKSQLEAPLRPRARLMEYGGGGFESHPPAAAHQLRDTTTDRPRGPCRPCTHHRPRGLNTQRAGVPPSGDQGQPVYIGGCPWPRPRQGSPNKAIARAGLACRGQPAGVSLPAKVRDAERRCPRERACLVHIWSTCHRSRGGRSPRTRPRHLQDRDATRSAQSGAAVVGGGPTRCVGASPPPEPLTDITWVSEPTSMTWTPPVVGLFPRRNAETSTPSMSGRWAWVGSPRQATRASAAIRPW
jgi:hypothetical protein